MVTQHPLSETVLDFWRLIEDHDIDRIIMITGMDDQVTLNMDKLI